MEKAYKILLVEDELKLGAIIKEELDRKGYETIIARDGKEAETLFNATNYSLILTASLETLSVNLSITRRKTPLMKRYPSESE